MKKEESLIQPVKKTAASSGKPAAVFVDAKKQVNGDDAYIYKEIIKNMPGGVYVVGLDDVIIKYANPRFEKIFGYNRGEMVGQHASIVNDPSDKDPQKTANDIMAVIRKTGSWHGEIRNVKKDGTPFWSLASVSVMDHPKYGKVIVAVHDDIDQIKKIEEKLKENEERYRLIYDSSSDAIMTLEPPDWRFTSGNPAAIKLFGAKNEAEFLSFGPSDLSPKYQPDGQLSSEKAKKMIEQALKEGSNFFEWVHKKHKGADFFATVLLSRIELRGKKFLQATVRDISEQKKNEAELERVAEEAKKINDMMIGRELKMVELKEKISKLESSK